MSEIILTVNNTEFASWKDASINTGIEQLAGKFDLTFSDRWSRQRQKMPFSPGDECKVFADDNLVIAGFVDDITNEISGTSTRDGVSGRDYTADLVDCSAANEPDEFKDINLRDLATKLCSPFNIRVFQDADTGEKFPVFKIQHGETVFEALERAARMRGILLVSAKDKGLFLTSPGVGTMQDNLIQGQNILAASKTVSYANRYSRYSVKGQQGGIGLDKYPAREKSTAAVANDLIVSRYRPLIIIAENQANAKAAKRRAEWEAATRAARGLSLSVTVQGWINSASELWEPNYYVYVKIPRLEIDAKLLIKACNYSISEQAGSTTTMQLVDEKAFLLQPEIKRDYTNDSERKLSL